MAVKKKTPKKKKQAPGAANETASAKEFNEKHSKLIKKKVGKRPRSRDHLSQVAYRIIADCFPDYQIEKEYIFHPTRRWRLDYAVPELRIGVEVHGGIWTGGRHTRGLGFQNDREKMNEAALRGWIILELTDKPIEAEHGEQARVWLRQAKRFCEEAFALQHKKIQLMKDRYDEQKKRRRK